MRTITNVCRLCDRVNVPDDEYLPAMSLCGDCVANQMNQVRELQTQIQELQTQLNIKDQRRQTNSHAWDTETRQHRHDVLDALLRWKIKFLWFGKKSTVCFVLPLAVLTAFFVYWYTKGRPPMQGTGWGKVLFVIVGIGAFLITLERRYNWKRSLMICAIALVGLSILGDEVLALFEMMILTLRNSFSGLTNTLKATLP